jgi:hypothetical protein
MFWLFWQLVGIGIALLIVGWAVGAVLWLLIGLHAIIRLCWAAAVAAFLLLVRAIRRRPQPRLPEFPAP